MTKRDDLLLKLSNRVNDAMSTLLQVDDSLGEGGCTGHTKKFGARIEKQMHELEQQAHHTLGLIRSGQKNPVFQNKTDSELGVGQGSKTTKRKTTRKSPGRLPPRAKAKRKTTRRKNL